MEYMLPEQLRYISTFLCLREQLPLKCFGHYTIQLKHYHLHLSLFGVNIWKMFSKLLK